ncbi:GGDEF domain-containing protein [Malaciobacter mytili]|uniref:GGDEF domain-containing protein n=1 Tax=Malaciobacter mytili TaxID=603050 RepID=UPI003BB09FB6
MRKKFTWQLLFIGIILTVLVTTLSLYNLRNTNLKSSIQNAQVIANVVKSGLTSHMINGNMDQVDTFINSVASMKNIEELWLIRSDLVKAQFGKENLRNPKDEIDLEVLKTGQIKYQLNESFTKTTMRVTVPYNSILENGIDCNKCHKVNYGDTLGAVSLKLDISDIKQVGLEITYLIPLMILLSILLILFLARRVNEHYVAVLEKLARSIKLAISGRFKEIVYEANKSNEIVTLIDDYNLLMSTFRDTSVDIERRLQGFIGQEANSSQINPLEKSKDIIKNLSNLYQFKKEIELDNTKIEIYNRLSEVFQNQFKIKHFTLIEIDNIKSKLTVVKSVGNSFYCKDNISDEPEFCRCARTKNDVISVDFHHSCPYFEKENKFHYCLNVEISKNIYLIINFVCETKNELEELKDKISFVKSYINEAAPSIEVKILMNALQESAFQDVLTGLYNRKFLEEHSKKLVPQIKRENLNIGVLLLDMDHFKAVNDEYGHDIGDKVLKELARILNETVRESDLIIRYGGEEFMVLLVGVNSDSDALTVANKIRENVRENEIDVYAGNKLKKTVSIGLSMFPQDSKTLDGVIKNADIALYEAKNSGRDKVVRFHESQVSSIDLF